MQAANATARDENRQKQRQMIIKNQIQVKSLGGNGMHRKIKEKRTVECKKSSHTKTKKRIALKLGVL